MIIHVCKSTLDNLFISEISLDPVSAVRSCPLSSLKKTSNDTLLWLLYICKHGIWTYNTWENSLYPHISPLINLSWLATKKLRSVYHTVHNKCSTCSSLHTDLKYKGNNFCRLIGTKKLTGRCRAECTRGAFNECQQKYYTIHRLYTYY